MSTQPNNEKKRERELNRVLSESILEISNADFRQLLDEDGETIEDLANRGKATISRVFVDVFGENHKFGKADSGSDAGRNSLGPFLRVLRRKDCLSIDELSEKADVSPIELRRIEEECDFEPSPRTIFQLENCFKLKRHLMAILAGVVRISGDPQDFRAKARDMQFAAKSDSMEQLTKSEKKMLNEYVRCIAEFVD